LNHFLNQKKKPNGPFADNFEDLGTLSDNALDIDISLEEQEAKKRSFKSRRGGRIYMAKF